MIKINGVYKIFSHITNQNVAVYTLNLSESLNCTGLRIRHKVQLHEIHAYADKKIRFYIEKMKQLTVSFGLYSKRDIPLVNYQQFVKCVQLIGFWKHIYLRSGQYETLQRT